jgi:hypothetical protein
LLTTSRDLGAPDGTTPTLSLPPCPLARQGLGSQLMPRCPGYAASPLSFAGLGAGESLGERETCGHLGTQRGPRGFVSACRHPGGVPAAAVELSRRARARTPRAGGRAGAN